MNRTLALVGCIGAIMLASIPPQAVADVEPIVYTQKLNTDKPLLLLEKIDTFKRIDAKIVTVKPWLNKENRIKKLTDKQLTTVLRRAGFNGKNLEVAKKIVFLESTNRPYAYNKSSDCYGLFQIRMAGSLGTDRRAKYGLSQKEDLFDPLVNAKIAYHMSNGGQNWSAWTTYRLIDN